LKALPPKSNFGLGLAFIFAGSVCNVIYTQYSNWAREKGLHSSLATAAIPVVEWKEKIIKSQSATLAIKFIPKAQSDYTEYNIIVGKRETGKTTLVCVTILLLSGNATGNDSRLLRKQVSLFCTRV